MNMLVMFALGAAGIAIVMFMVAVIVDVRGNPARRQSPKTTAQSQAGPPVTEEP